MSYQRGDRVEVKGYKGKEAVLVVWREVRNGLLLCTEVGFRRKMSGEDAPVIGFPTGDIKGLHDEAQSAGAS